MPAEFSIDIDNFSDLMIAKAIHKLKNELNSLNNE